MANRIFWHLDKTLEFFATSKKFETEKEMLASIFDFKVQKLSRGKRRHTAGDPELVFERIIIRKLLERKLLIQLNETHYEMLVEGMIFIQSPPWPYLHRPFTYERFKERLSIAWNVVKVVALVLNALAILYIGWLQVKKG
jgi:hypothetical protein